jgi:hypothetical protein
VDTEEDLVIALGLGAGPRTSTMVSGMTG